jgi:hypothetical protein
MFSGKACEAAAVKHFLQAGYNVAPGLCVDNGCDLLVCPPSQEQWLKVQVKKVVRNPDGGSNFFFNSTNRAGDRMKKYDVDLFVHVVLTCHRELIFITPDSAVPRIEGRQVMCKTLVLERHNRVHSKQKDLHVLSYLVSEKYSPKLIGAFPDFPFVKTCGADQ